MAPSVSGCRIAFIRMTGCGIAKKIHHCYSFMSQTRGIWKPFFCWTLVSRWHVQLQAIPRVSPPRPKFSLLYGLIPRWNPCGTFVVHILVICRPLNYKLQNAIHNLPMFWLPIILFNRIIFARFKKWLARWISVLVKNDSDPKDYVPVFW